MNFKTRPHFEDRQIVQRVGESIRLSGDTLYSTTGGLIVEPTVLDFTGSTTGQTTVTINNLTGYLNDDNRLSGLIVNPPVLKLSGSTGTTTVNVENFVLKAIDSNGSAAWSPISGISWSVSACTSPFLTTDIQPCTPGGTITVNAGNLEVNNSLRINDGTQSNGYVFTSDGSGNGSWQPSYEFTGNTSGGCITDIFVTNVHSCSPLNINPLDEGNVYFGSTSGITIDVINNRLGINNPNPLYTLDISGTTGEKLEFQPSGTAPRLLLSVNQSNRLNRVAVIDTTNTAGIEMGFRGSTEPSFPTYGKQGDSFIRAGNNSNGLNIIEAPTSPFENYIRFFAGQNANTTPDIHIQGTGPTRGFVGINNITPTERLDVVGKTKTTDFQMTNGATNGYVLTSDSLGNASWQAQSVTGGTNTFTTGATLSNSVISFDRTDLANAYNVDIQPVLDNYLPLEITGNTLVTVDNSVLNFSGNSTSEIQSYVTHDIDNVTGLFIDEDAAQLVNVDFSDSRFYLVQASKLTGVRLASTFGPSTRAQIQITGSEIDVVGDSSFSGITYNDDYSLNFINRSLVDKEYVDLAISGFSQTLSQTLSNGNTTNGNNIIVSSGDTIYGNDLLLSGDTSITSKIENVNFISEVEVTENRVGMKSLFNNGNYSESFVAPLEFQSIVYDNASTTNLTSIVGQNNGGLPLLTLQATDPIGFVQDVLNFDPANTGSGTGLVSLDTSTSEYSQITLTPSQLQIKSDDLVDSRNVTITPTTIQVNGGFAEYDADYSTNYTNRSLVDKEYVDNVVSGGTFTGNTSGSCITDLYISNLYGCSPITVHDDLDLIGKLYANTGNSELDLTFMGDDNVIFLGTTGSTDIVEGLLIDPDKQRDRLSIFSEDTINSQRSELNVSSTNTTLSTYGGTVDEYDSNIGTIYNPFANTISTVNSTLSVLGTASAQIRTIVDLTADESLIILTSDEVQVNTINLLLPNIPTYADNAAAITGGLPANAVYKTSLGELRIRV
jgi:hypothetical protein